MLAPHFPSPMCCNFQQSFGHRKTIEGGVGDDEEETK